MKKIHMRRKKKHCMIWEPANVVGLMKGKDKAKYKKNENCFRAATLFPPFAFFFLSFTRSLPPTHFFVFHFMTFDMKQLN